MPTRPPQSGRETQSALLATCDSFLLPSVQSDKKLSLCVEYHVNANNVPLSPDQSGSGISSHILLSDFANNYTVQQFPRPRIYWAKKSVSKFQKDQLELLVAGLEIRAIAMIWKTLYSWALIAIDKYKYTYFVWFNTDWDCWLQIFMDNQESSGIFKIDKLIEDEGGNISSGSGL